MQIRSFAVLDHLVLQVVFVDGASLRIEFDPARLKGVDRALTEPSTFGRARLEAGTVVWPCGSWIDASLARIRADEVPVWRPL